MFSVYCIAHCLNLVLVDCVKKAQEAGEFFTLVQQLYVLMSGSYLHQSGWKVKVKSSVVHHGMPSLSDTRWACRCTVKTSWVASSNDNVGRYFYEPDTDRGVKTRSILCQIDLNFIWMLAVFRNVTKHRPVLDFRLD